MDHIKIGSQVKIVKGCRARNITKGQTAYVSSVQDMGAEYSHMVKVTLQLSGRTVSFWARHINRLSDPIVNLNDGNPLNKIQIKKA